MGRGNINQRLNGLNPLSYMGDNAYQPPEFVTDNRAPNSNDSMNFELGTIWLDTKTVVPPTANNVWILVALRAGVATWVNFSAGIMTLTSNSGGAVSPTAGNINVVGDGTTIVGVGVPGTSTITFSTVGTGVVSTLTGNSGSAVPPTAGNINVVVGASTGTPTIIGTPGTSTLSLTFSNIATGNLGIGTASLASATVGANDNTAYGGNSLTLVTTGDNNTAIGWNAGSTYTTESSNISIGANVNGTAADNNTLRVGAGSGAGAGQLARAFVSGIAGVVTANSALVTINTVTDQLGSTAQGVFAVSFPTDSGTAVPSAGVLNVLGGTAARDINTSGSGNTIHIDLKNAITLGDLVGITGSPALTATTGDVTLSAGNVNITNTTTAGTSGEIRLGGNRFLSNYGTQNTFVGNSSGNTSLTVVTAVNNTGFGDNVLTALTTGIGNTAVGQAVLAFVTTPIHNTGVGSGALNIATTGAENTAIGESSYRQLLTGNRNIGLGRASGNNYTGAESDNILIGYNVVGTVGESNIMRVGIGTGAGSGQLAKNFISGIRGVTTDVNDAVPVLIDSAGQLGVTSSSLRYKENVADIGDYSDAIFSLRPVVFNYKNHSPESKSYGLIAEEVEQVMPKLVVYNEEGKPETVKYQDLVPMLLNEIQKLEKRIEMLENR